MIAQEMTILKRLKRDDEVFSSIISNITVGNDLTQEEYSYLLSLSYLFSEEYSRSGKIGYFEFAYYLILNYSLKTQDFEPLLEFSLNYGFYPIAKHLLTQKDKTIIDFLLESGIENYKFNNLIQLKEQKEKLHELINSESSYRALIAPTSYGKSSFIVDDLNKRNDNVIGIIVPKKALIWQTYRNIKRVAKELNYKILLHDTEYNHEQRFLGVFTQERALRLIQDNNVCFDLLYIDEAHNLFEKDERNMLLSRLIKLNKKLNNNQKVVFLSPLIRDVNNLKFNGQEIIDAQKIQFNIKEYDIKFYSLNNESKIYNRFVDEFYIETCKYNGGLDFIRKNSKDKNLIYLYKPKNIEDLAQILINKFDDILDTELDEIKNILCKYVHEEYLMSSLIKKGIIYIHSKVPDLVKDYLIEKFKTCKKIKYLISNTSVLEGVNFPIESIFILDVYALSGNNLKNLCGRVNRLNEIFGAVTHLNKLLCPINFVQISDISSRNSFENKIRLLRCDIEDDVQNPLLKNSKMEKTQKDKIVATENAYIEQFKSKALKTVLIKNSINIHYNNFDVALSRIEDQLKITKKIEGTSELIDLICSVFITRFEFGEISDYELLRLKNEKTRKFYKNYLHGIFYADIKSKVKYFLDYFKYYEEQNMSFYIGTSFGEESFSSEYYSGNRLAYINPKYKTYKQKVNLAVIKSKLEDDFISYKLAKFVKALLDLELISDDIYHSFLFNSTNAKIIELMNAGFSYQLISFVINKDLQNEISLTATGITVSQKFRNALNLEDDFIRFEINKIL